MTLEAGYAYWWLGLEVPAKRAVLTGQHIPVSAQDIDRELKRQTEKRAADAELLTRRQFEAEIERLRGGQIQQPAKDPRDWVIRNQNQMGH